MDEGKKGTPNNHLTCDVCKIDFNSNADFALHEFSKKHCDNLIRLAKQKPVVSKHKAKSEIPQVEKQQPKVNSVTHSGSFAKYGYFVPGEIYVHSEVSKEFNTDYDPYLQKFAENPFKEKSSLQPQNETPTFSPTASFSKKKKRKVKVCQVCNITFLTLPEYEAHMKSPQHIWKLKVTGMGVSAHFVKASADLHTTDINEESNKPDVEEEEETAATAASHDSSSSGPFPLLYCSDCELLLNSPQQYNAHINGKVHIECAQRKAELKAKKEKLENPMPNQLYCYSCKISLNNLFQYNEHKNGKKHKTRCRSLIRKGITIPPEERVSGLPHPNPNKPVVYPELYEKLVLEKQKQKDSVSKSDLNLTNNESGVGESPPVNTPSGPSFGVNCHTETRMDVLSELGEKSVDSPVKCLALGIEEKSNTTIETVLHTEVKNDCVFEKSRVFSHESNATPQVQVARRDEPVPGKASTPEESPADPATAETSMNADVKEEPKTQVSIVTDDKPVRCSICNENFYWQSQLDAHLGTEDHLRKILELKLRGKSEGDILKVMFSDRNVVKPNNSGEFSCSICNVTTDNGAEFDQHLNSIVHKYTEKDYRNRRALEVKHLVTGNEKGEYFCKLCQEGWPSLVEFAQHLHFVKHKSIQRAQRAKVVLAKRKTSHVQKQRLMQSAKKRNLLRRGKAEKTPGVRTKVCGVATNPCAGGQASVPNPEPPESKIDVEKNTDRTTLGNDKNSDESKTPKTKKRNQMQRPNRKFQDGIAKQLSRGRGPFPPSGGVIPPLMPRLPYPRFSRPGLAPPSRNWAPFSSPRPPMFGPFCGAPSPMGNPYLRPQRFLRPPWPRHRPPFPHF